MTLCRRFALALLLTGLAALSAVQAQEKKIKRADLPPAVEKTVAEETKNAAVRGFSTEIENGQKLYEAELVVNGHGKDITMDESGKVVEVEEEVLTDALPAAVKDGITKGAGTGTVGKVESITKNGKLVAYEAVVKKGTKHSEIQVGPDGKKLAHPE